MTAKYILDREVLGTVTGAEHRTVVKIPEGSVVSFRRPVAGQPRFVEVLWEGQRVWIFASDLPEVANPEESKALHASAAAGEGISPQPTPVQPSEVKVRRFNAAGREL